MSNEPDKTSGVVSLIPQLFYDIIARLIPGSITIGALALAIAGPEESKEFIKVCLNKPSEQYPSILIIVGLGFVLSYTIAVILLGFWSLPSFFSKLALNITSNSNRASKARSKKFSEEKREFWLMYDFIKRNDPAAGNRITKLKAEIHMTRILILGFSLSFIISLYKINTTLSASKWLLAIFLFMAIVGSIGAKHHFTVRRDSAVGNHAQILGYQNEKIKKGAGA